MKTLHSLPNNIKRKKVSTVIVLHWKASFFFIISSKIVVLTALYSRTMLTDTDSLRFRNCRQS